MSWMKTNNIGMSHLSKYLKKDLDSDCITPIIIKPKQHGGMGFHDLRLLIRLFWLDKLGEIA